MMANEFNPDAYLAKKSAFNPDEFLKGESQGGVTSNVSAGNPDVPGGGQVSHAQSPTEKSVGDYIEAVAETAVAMGTGAVLGAPAYIAGAIPDAIDQLAGNPDQKYRESFSSAVTNTPESETGQEYAQWASEVLGVLPPVGLTGGVKPKIGKPQRPLSPFAKKVSESTNENVKKSFKKRGGDERYTPRIFGMVKESVKQGYDERLVDMIVNATPLNKRKFRKQITVMEAGKKNLEHEQTYRPSDVAGDSILKQIDFVRDNNKKAGKQLSRVVRKLEEDDKPLDISDPIKGFVNDLSGIGVKISKDGELDFFDSTVEFSPSSKALLTNALEKIKRDPKPTAHKAHMFKKFLDEDLFKGKQSEGGVSGSVERILGKLRVGMNDTVGEVSKGYKEANARFSDTITSLDKLENVVGRKLNQKGPNADKAFGQQLRSLLNDSKGRTNLMDAVSDIEQTAHKYGGSFDDNILQQMLFADELEIMHGGAGRKGFKTQVKGGNVDAAIDISQMSIPGAIAVGAKALNKRRLGINEENQLKSLKKLLNAK